ncbi:hypothetical protein PRK78_006841 [Emydomyces testavorans]|uniref:Uncharacterized protein n=1 Tax=Emydomyces testavorans TaxID=2070801 RepID=A0AAF0DM55_9EURO|nr:hypothetical protein PRK78_006841 [Emydomyces testavorans]
MASTTNSSLNEDSEDKHPLQKLSSPSFGVSAMVHMALTNRRRNDAYGWHFQYLTIIGLTLATLTFAAGLGADIFLSRRLFLVKNVLSVCSSPLAVLIAVLYWGLKMVNINRCQSANMHADPVMPTDR